MHVYIRLRFPLFIPAVSAIGFFARPHYIVSRRWFISSFAEHSMVKFKRLHSFICAKLFTFVCANKRDLQFYCFPNETKTSRNPRQYFVCFAINCRHRKIPFAPIFRTTFKRGLHIRYVRCDLDVFMTDDETKQRKQNYFYFHFSKRYNDAGE